MNATPVHPFLLVTPMSRRAFFSVASLSKESRASTSVETRPGTMSRIALPKESGSDPGPHPPTHPRQTGRLAILDGSIN